MRKIKGIITKVICFGLSELESSVVSLLRNIKTKVILLNKKQKPDANFFRRFHGLSRVIRLLNIVSKILFWIYIAPIIFLLNAWWVIVKLFVRLFLGKSQWVTLCINIYQEAIHQIDHVQSKIISSEAFELMLYCLTTLVEVSEYCCCKILINQQLLLSSSSILH